jgi:hypothetical protein
MSTRNDGVVRGTELKLDMALAGIQALIAPGTSVSLDGVSMTQQELVDKVNSYRTPRKQYRDLRSQAEQQRIAVVNSESDAKKLITALKATAQTLLGASNPDLTKFGFKPKKKRVRPTSGQQVLKTARADATRESRGTKGPLQKEGVKGDVTQVVVDQAGKVHPSSAAGQAESTKPTS